MKITPPPKNKTINNLPKMTGDVGYGLGFFCGCLVGIIGTYLIVSPEGQKLKTKIIKEYQHNLQTLTLNELMSDRRPQLNSNSLAYLKNLIKKLKTQLSSFSEPRPLSPKSSRHSQFTPKHFFKQN